MSFLEILGLVVSGAGTLASVLGVFFGIYARQNGRTTREFIRAQNQDMREFIAKVLERLGEQISHEGEKTREEIRRLRQSTG